MKEDVRQHKNCHLGNLVEVVSKNKKVVPALNITEKLPRVVLLKTIYRHTVNLNYLLFQMVRTKHDIKDIETLERNLIEDKD